MRKSIVLGGFKHLGQTDTALMFFAETKISALKCDVSGSCGRTLNTRVSAECHDPECQALKFKYFFYIPLHNLVPHFLNAVTDTTYSNMPAINSDTEYEVKIFSTSYLVKRLL